MSKVVARAARLGFSLLILAALPAAACELYPIALSVESIADAQPGDVVEDVLNGSQAGNFGWLTWSGDMSVPALARSLTPPGDSDNYVNPEEGDDHEVSPGDWVRGQPGVANSRQVRDALDALKEVDIVLPIWDSARGQGSAAQYRIAGFAAVRIVDYRLPGQNRITARFLGFTSCGPTNSPGDDSYASPPAGFVRVAISSNSSRLVSLPFEPWNSAVGAVFTNQLTGGPQREQADEILLWDAGSQEYVAIYKRDGQWVTAEGSPCTERLDVGQGFWVLNRHNDQVVFLCGGLVMEDTRTVSLVPGLSLFGYPFSSLRALDETFLRDSGALGGQDAGSSDLVLDSLGNAHWLLAQAGHTNDGHWMSMVGGVSDLQLGMGSGFWYDRLTSTPLLWTEPRPYPDVFSASPETPRIVSLAPTSNGNAVELSLVCLQGMGAQIELFYKDLSPTQPTEPTSGWHAADDAALPAGLGLFSWTDYGSVTRGPVTSVFSRLYLAGRRDKDTDQDGLSNTREAFLHHTSITNADSDADGVQDGHEVARGTDPTDPASVNTNLYVNGIIGANWMDGLAPVVTNGHGPKASLQAAIDAAVSGDPIYIAEGGYHEPRLDPAGKRVLLLPTGRVRIQ